MYSSWAQYRVLFQHPHELLKVIVVYCHRVHHYCQKCCGLVGRAPAGTVIKQTLVAVRDELIVMKSKNQFRHYIWVCQERVERIVMLLDDIASSLYCCHEYVLK
mgnify:CR=1 FL=1